ncbi:MAG TPA: gamma carbonic anhydrase family protein, partial [Candidatus Sumerlaeota bacterium]|nr:gamma carbonic anhydrase family protein [Candidatus Sumerlaeota bacterium]
MPIIPFENFTPRIHPSAFIAPNAIILGDVEIGEESTVW